jgi:hypothetical protein
VEAPTGRYGGFATTSVDESHPDADDGYDWHAPQTLAPNYGDEAGGDQAQSSAQAWWDQVRSEHGLDDAGQPGSAFSGSTTQTNGAVSAVPQQAAAHNDHADHTEAIARLAPPEAEQPVPDPAAEYVPAYNAGGYQQEPSWQQNSRYGTPSAPNGVPESAEPQGSAGPRRARLSLRRVDPWSTLKFSLVLAVALFVVWMVAVGVLYGVLSGMGVFDKINSTVNEVNGSTGKTVTPQIVLGLAGVIGGVSIVLFTALATVGSFIYNLCADMVGGLEVTLAERD